MSYPVLICARFQTYFQEGDRAHRHLVSLIHLKTRLTVVPLSALIKYTVRSEIIKVSLH
jgi:hypothetical protein